MIAGTQDSMYSLYFLACYQVSWLLHGSKWLLELQPLYIQVVAPEKEETKAESKIGFFQLCQLLLNSVPKSPTHQFCFYFTSQSLVIRPHLMASEIGQCIVVYARWWCATLKSAVPATQGPIIWKYLYLEEESFSSSLTSDLLCELRQFA